MICLVNKSVFEISNILKQKLTILEVHEIIEFSILDPDNSNNHIGYKALVDLAQMLYCKMLTPHMIGNDTIKVRFQKLNTQDSFHNSSVLNNEKYGTDSTFATIEKNNQPSFLLHYIKALQNVDINKRLRILNLGINSGDEFSVIKQFATNFKNIELVGIDYCPSAIKEAKKKFQDTNITFLEADINQLSDLNLGEFDLIITIGTLQSSNLDFNKVFMNLVQNHLKKDGAMIVGFPNCRWCDGEMIYGANVKNYNFSEMSVLYKDVVFCKKYMQQKKFRVTITGKDYIFLTATSIRK